MKKYLSHLFTLTLVIMLGWQASRVYAACDVPAFQLGNFYDGPPYPSRAVVRDFNGDGKLDLATNGSLNNVHIFLGNGAGGFAPSVAYPVGFQVTKLESADFNSDGKLDLAVLSFSESSPNHQVDVAILNGDGRAEIAVYRHSINNWIMRESNGQASFYPSNMTGNSIAPQPADYDGNGRMDRVAWRPSDGFWYEALTLSAQFFLGSTGDIPVTSLFGRNQ